MFVLRIIQKKPNGLETNISLGKSYTYITKEENPQEFLRTYVQLFGQSEEPEETLYGFVVSDQANDIHPLWNFNWYYVMTGGGKTFSNVSLA